MKKAGYRKKGS